MKVTYGAIVQRASGRFGGTVHSNWKGVDVVRRFAKPSNPNTVNQQYVRQAFRGLTRMYSVLSTNVLASWTSYAVGKQLIARNKFIGVNVPLVSGLANVGGMLPTPGDAGTIPPLDFTPVGGLGQITTTIQVPAAPSGWTLISAVACCVPDTWTPTNGTPPTFEDVRFYEAEDVSAPYAPTISGLPDADYYTWAFIVWQDPSGTNRYSAPIAGGLITVT